jgi:hypothetical protein
MLGKPLALLVPTIRLIRRVVVGTRIALVPGLPYVGTYRVRGEEVAVLHTARRRRD